MVSLLFSYLSAICLVLTAHSTSGALQPSTVGSNSTEDLISSKIWKQEGDKTKRRTRNQTLQHCRSCNGNCESLKCTMVISTRPNPITFSFAFCGTHIPPWQPDVLLLRCMVAIKQRQNDGQNYHYDPLLWVYHVVTCDNTTACCVLKHRLVTLTQLRLDFCCDMSSLSNHLQAEFRESYDILIYTVQSEGAFAIVK